MAEALFGFPPGVGTLFVVALLGAKVGHDLHDDRLCLLAAVIGLVLAVSVMCVRRSDHAPSTLRSVSA